MKYSVPILCEKPICKDIKQIKDLFSDLKMIPFNMVYQYQYALEGAIQKDHERSWYDYYDHGQDTLPWDCIQIIGLAKSYVRLSDKQDVWDCSINGSKLNLRMIQLGYRQMITHWLSSGYGDKSKLLEIHEKTIEFEANPKIWQE